MIRRLLCLGVQRIDELGSMNRAPIGARAGAGTESEAVTFLVMDVYGAATRMK